ncbi:hypothetical protein KAZ66_02340 [Candidatus Woesebacteria bacterium]|nr:hypothetical protein [Candidatus Woesebacteria bacterium]
MTVELLSCVDRVPQQPEIKQLPPEYNPLGNKERVFELFKCVAEQASDKISTADIYITEERLHKVYDEFENGPSGPPPTSFFVIHPRDPFLHPNELPPGFEEFIDIPRYWPALDRRMIDPALIEYLFSLLPPHEVGRTSGVGPNGRQIECSIMAASLTPYQLYGQALSAPERVRWAQPRIDAVAKLASQWGASVVGLGETLGALTKHGERLQDRYPNLQVTTGHAMTTYGILKTAEAIAQKSGANLPDLRVTLIGAAGSIGRATAVTLAAHGAQSLILHDVEGSEKRLEKLAEELRNTPGARPDLHIQMMAGNGQGLEDACRQGELLLSMASAPWPFMDRDHLEGKLGHVDDSQPPCITRVEADAAGTPLVWPVLQLPDNFHRTFDYGLRNAEFTCCEEVLAIQMNGGVDYETTGPVDAYKVAKVTAIAEHLGFQVPTLQSFGQEIPKSMFRQRQ